MTSINVQYKGINDSPSHDLNSYRTRQETYHPYIAQPSGNSSSIPHWSTVCFSNFTDNIRKAFHDLNFVVLSMELLEWAGYYNTSHANPYNSLSFTHFGMPSNFSRAYQAVTHRDTENCGSRLRSSIQTRGARDYSKQNFRDRIAIVQYCQTGIDCIWRNECHLFKTYAESLGKIANKENVYKYESILGALIEDYDEITLFNLLYEDLGCYIETDDPGDQLEKDNILYDYEDILNHIVASTRDVGYFEYLLREINYWPSDIAKVKDRVDEEITGNDEQMKRAMLQWVTERSI